DRTLLSGVGHPLETGDRLAVGLNEVGDEVVHRGLRRGWKVTVDIDLPDRFAHDALDERHATLPALANLRRAGEGASVEVEVGLDEVARQIGGMRADDLPAQPVGPLGKPISVQQFDESLDETGLPQNEF